jgi:hypothetical protein
LALLRVRYEVANIMPIDNAGTVKPPRDFCIAVLDKLIGKANAS